MTSHNPVVLVVDDDLDTRLLLQDVLMDAGYAVQLAYTGQIALELIEESPPDLILLDLLMPDMNGWDVLQILRAKPEAQNIPVILLSALGKLDNVAEETHVRGYLAKPFSIDVALKTVAEALSQQ